VTQEPLFEKHTLHHTSKSIEHSLGRKVLRGNEIDEVLLPSFLLHICCQNWMRVEGRGETYILENAIDSRVCMFKIRG
jgi:hypothetical protein